MKAKHFVLVGIFLLSFGSVTFANRTLDRAEILQIFEHLTSKPKKTWMPSGTIEATHEEYRAPETTNLEQLNDKIKERVAEYQNNPNKQQLTDNLQKMKLDAIPFNIRYKLSNEYTMSSSVVVKFDGDRFYWQIKVDSRADSVKPGKKLAGNFMTDQFDMNWNARRIFAWDGEKYTTYFLPGNHAIVDSTGSTPHVVNGPLTAGVVPWGYGYYSYDKLVAVDSIAVEKYVDGQMQIELTLNNPSGSEVLFVLDPAKDYAILSCSVNEYDNSVISKQYSGYQLVSGNWIPAVILIEKYEAVSNRVLIRDLWNITSVDANVPQSYDFNVSYEDDVLIEYFSPVTNEPMMYRYSQIVDTDALLAERLAFAASKGTQPQNCATAALKYVTSQLGKEISDQQLAQLVSEPNGQTNLYQMKQFAQSLGLCCRAVETDIETLKRLNGCKAIMHIPGKNHFIVLESIDANYIWAIDLASNKFYYRTDINFFGMDWSEGTVLLISNQPITGEFVEIDGVELQIITGAAGYSCTKLLQDYFVIYCTYIGGACLGTYQEYYTRYGCERAESGSCSNSILIRYQKSPCIIDPYDPLACDVTGEWTSYYMRACL